MIKFRNLLSIDLWLRKLLESTEAYACCIFDQGLLQSVLVDVDEANFDSIGQCCYKFVGSIQAGLQIYVKFDSEVDTLELIFETDKREFCASINKQKFIDQDELEWNRLSRYWMGLLNKPKLLEQTFNQSLVSTGLPKSFIEWDSSRFHSGIKPGNDRDRSEKIFRNLLLDIYDSLRLRFNLNFVEPSTWKHRYWSCKRKRNNCNKYT